MARKLIVLHSAMGLDAVKDVLRREVDEERWTLFSLSGFTGARPVVGKMEGDRLRLRKRRDWHDAYAVQFYGRMEAEPGGTRIVGYFDFPRWVHWFMRLWLALAVVISVPIFVLTLSDVVRGTHFMHGGGEWVGLLVAPAFLAYGFLLPALGRWLGRGGERYILQFMETVLAARVD
jgi:hypothetical protein